MTDRLRRTGTRIRTFWACIAVAWLIPVLVLRLIGFAVGLLWRGRRVRWRFDRALRRSGLTSEEVEELSGLYDPTIPVRHILRERRGFRRV